MFAKVELIFESRSVMLLKSIQTVECTIHFIPAYNPKSKPKKTTDLKRTC